VKWPALCQVELSVYLVDGYEVKWPALCHVELSVLSWMDMR